MYVLQTVVHSFVTLLIIESSLRIWQVENARERFRYRLLIIILPFFMFPVFQFVDPGRGSFYFVQDSAIFSSMRWLRIDLFGKLPIGFIFLFLIFSVSAVVFVQEIIPVSKDLFSKKNRDSGQGEGYDCCPADPELNALVDEMSRSLKIESPTIKVIDDENPVIFTSGTTTHTIVISQPLLAILDSGQMKSALAHELAHILRRSNFTTLLVFVIRICMFYNPISLIEFRRLVQDDEHICDDITVSLTGDPHALASALRAFSLDMPHQHEAGIFAVRETIEISSHNLLLEERIERLENNGPFEYYSSGWSRLALTAAGIVTINFFIV
jgi:Zn-dependent protease with chaperone function